MKIEAGDSMNESYYGEVKAMRTGYFRIVTMFIELNIKTKRHTVSTISIIESQDTRVFFFANTTKY